MDLFESGDDVVHWNRYVSVEGGCDDGDVSLGCWLVVRRKVRKWGVMEEGINVIVGWVCECMTRKFVEGGVKK